MRVVIQQPSSLWRDVLVMGLLIMLGVLTVLLLLLPSTVR